MYSINLLVLLEKIVCVSDRARVHVRARVHGHVNVHAHVRVHVRVRVQVRVCDRFCAWETGLLFATSTVPFLGINWHCKDVKIFKSWLNRRQKVKAESKLVFLQNQIKMPGPPSPNVLLFEPISDPC